MDAHEQTFGYKESFPNRSTARLISIYGYLPGAHEPAYAHFDKFVWLLMELERNHVGNPITLVIDSLGGDTDTLEILLDHIKLMTSPVRTVARNVSSAAAILFTAGAKGHRYAFERSQIMLHPARPSCECPTHEQPAQLLLDEGVTQLNRRLAQLLDKCTEGKILNLLDDWRDESDEEKRISGVLTLLEKTVRLDGKAAVEYGLADYTIGEKEFHDLFFR